jgi:hypothetical protein
VPFLVGRGLDVSDNAGAIASGRHISRENSPAGEGGTPESDFWWRVFEAKWFFLVFGRWCVDIRERNIMWRLPIRACSELAEIGVKNILHLSPYSLEEVQLWLTDHDAHAWESRCIYLRIRGLIENTSTLIENRIQFVCIFCLPPTYQIFLVFLFEPLLRRWR